VVTRPPDVAALMIEANLNSFKRGDALCQCCY
jgi:hypothetical protein